jgi:hypothetical protein
VTGTTHMFCLASNSNCTFDVFLKSFVLKSLFSFSCGFVKNLRVLVAPVLLGFVDGRITSYAQMVLFMVVILSISFSVRPRKLQQNPILLVLLIRALVSVLVGLTLHQESFFTRAKTLCK